MAFDLLRELDLFLATCRTASVATCDDQMRPHAANVQYCHDNRFRLYWVSSPGTLHSRHIAAQNRVALTIYAHDDSVHQIHGAQFHATVRAIQDRNAWHDAFELYTTKYAFAAALPQVRERIERERFYVATPTWVRWIDNRRSFGFKAEMDLEGTLAP